jgi:glycogen debranching enzyme
MVATPLQALPEADEVSEYHIEAQTSLVERSLRTLKHGDAFAVTDAYGDIGVLENSAEGLFFRDMRHLSRFRVWFAGRRPLLLSSVVQDDNAALSVDLTNPDIEGQSAHAIPRDTIALERLKFLTEGTCYERIAIRNFDTQSRRFPVGITFEADFKDLFEVRGVDRLRRGSVTSEVIDPGTLELRYVGLDGSTRTTRLVFSPAPRLLEPTRAIYDIALDGRAQTSIGITIELKVDGQTFPSPGLLRAYAGKRRALRAATHGIATVATSNSLLNEILCQSTADLHMLLTDTPHGRYPYAGIPWYSTVFGRDGIITAMLMLWLDPSIAKGVLTLLAATQATDTDPASDAQPGKILHERRQGEMALLGEVPFRRYYGTVDATPLYIMLAGMYFERTGDRDTIAAIWPNVKAALAWIDTYGDRDGDGFVEYFRETPQGLANQGWKDSHDSICHADGTLAEGPIALVEVQGYVYAAKQKAAALAHLAGEPELAARLTREADALRVAFDTAFWCDEIATYALALDGRKQPCRVRTSNAGHALMTGIADPRRAASVAAALLNRNGSSGWGIRTLARGEARYNPMSYHNGSVWPHDNAIVALGLSRYGLKREAVAIFEAMFGAALYQDDHRLPELYCGFSRQRRRGPTSYPVACSPQAWAAATPFALLAACLGITIDHARGTLNLRNPVFPEFMDCLELRDVMVGSSRVDLRLDARRPSGSVSVEITRRIGDAQILIHN